MTQNPSDSHATTSKTGSDQIAPVRAAGLLRRWLTFLFGIWVMTVGIALSIHGQLGTSPISTIPAVLDAATMWTVGSVTIVMNIAFVLLQMLILRRRFKAFQLVQLPIAVLFGTLIDLSVYLTSWVQPDHYLMQWVVTIIGALILGIGVYIQIQPKLLYLPGEGLVMALTQVTTVRFGTMKQLVDWSLVVISAVMSLILLQRLENVREGTVFAAFAVGAVVKTIEHFRTRHTSSTQ
ncbi:DUF6198 family protein [Enteractinococcus fodinae]|uniref:Membrane protein YczE n=1 Tax=Enteractinococcus fodinae TaxID=684663 RepID=A0ABU2AZ84_9MICC|nr:DUF6198 family protein [Enteractinococcus fodinae]MDR7346084.1 putative membrane protein YczE [Enteractinococcus fodinae]